MLSSSTVPRWPQNTDTSLITVTKLQVLTDLCTVPATHCLWEDGLQGLTLHQLLETSSVTPVSIAVFGCDDNLLRVYFSYTFSL